MHIVDRCVFIPWPRADAADFVALAADATNKGSTGAAHRARDFSTVCWDDAGKPLEDLGISLTTRIEIIGHGAAGDPYLCNKEDDTGPGAVNLPFNIVCDRLIEKGLLKRYAG